jgi:hypothetical protein
VLDGWCREVGRDPAEIERSVLISRPDEIQAVESFVEVGATHILLGLDEPWNFADVEHLVKWRDSR